MALPTLSSEHELRAHAISYVTSLAEANGGLVRRAELEAFQHEGERISLIDTGRGIRNPRQLAATITVLSSKKGPYNDEELGTGLVRYAYRSGRPDAGDNVKLRRAAELALPLIYLKGIDAGVFVPFAPVYVIDDDPSQRVVTLAMDESLRMLPDPRHLTDDQRRYAERLAKLRLHQPVFRARVLRAYGACAICRLRHVDLLDAAHILPDIHPLGTPVIPNGISLCKIHHAAYDRNILGVRPDLTVEVRADILAEIDGPMLRHGLQEMSGTQLLIPRGLHDQPDPARLATRYDEFLRA